MDTGAGLTTLDINQAKHFGFSSTESTLSVGAFNNNMASIQETIGITSIRIDKIEVIGDVIYATNMSKLVKHVETCAHKRISGIIGVPIIKRHGLVIDLTNNRLYKDR